MISVCLSSLSDSTAPHWKIIQDEVTISLQPLVNTTTFKAEGYFSLLLLPFKNKFLSQFFSLSLCLCPSQVKFVQVLNFLIFVYPFNRAPSHFIILSHPILSLLFSFFILLVRSTAVALMMMESRS